jgi:hypothetical protein
MELIRRDTTFADQQLQKNGAMNLDIHHATKVVYFT